MNPDQFIFRDYSFNEKTKTAVFIYGFSSGQTFSESYKFDFDFTNFNSEALNRAIETLFFLAGVSYFKAYLPTQIVVKKGQIDQNMAKFLSNTYQKGLGELFYKNKIDPTLQIEFPINSKPKQKINVASDGFLVAIGGGKDSLVSYELLSSAKKLATWSVGHKSQLRPLVERIGAKHFWVERQIDPNIVELSKNTQVYNGHIPISAIFAAVSNVVAILTGYKDSVVSNEQSANEENLIYEGVSINHQYSKTSEFEQNYQKLIEHNYGQTFRYYSLSRPLSEASIAKEFANKYFDKYQDVFSSCNKAYTLASDHIFWCKNCPKCAGISLLLSPFMRPGKINNYFGQNMLLSENLEPVYKQLLGIEGEKPLECVGAIAENRWAMTKMKSVYPELEKYKYQDPLPEQVWHVSPHNIPKDVIQQFDLENKYRSLAQN